MDKSAAERDVRAIYLCRGLSAFSLMLAIVVVMPMLFAIGVAMGQVFVAIWCIFVILFCVIVAIFASAVTFFVCWAFEGFRSFMGGAFGMVNAGTAIEVMAKATPVVFSAFKAVCPVFAVLAICAAVGSLVLSLKNPLLPCAKRTKVKSIIVIVLAAVGAITYAALLFTVYSAVL